MTKSSRWVWWISWMLVGILLLGATAIEMHAINSQKLIQQVSPESPPDNLVPTPETECWVIGDIVYGFACSQ